MTISRNFSYLFPVLILNSEGIQVLLKDIAAYQHKLVQLVNGAGIPSHILKLWLTHLLTLFVSHESLAVYFFLLLYSSMPPSNYWSLCSYCRPKKTTSCTWWYVMVRNNTSYSAYCLWSIIYKVIANTDWIAPIIPPPFNELHIPEKSPTPMYPSCSFLLP